LLVHSCRQFVVKFFWFSLCRCLSSIAASELLCAYTFVSTGDVNLESMQGKDKGTHLPTFFSRVVAHTYR
jgi:hypothetical protein